MNVKHEIDTFLRAHKDKKVLVAFDYSGSISSQQRTEPFQTIVDHINQTNCLDVVFVDWKIMSVTNTKEFKFPTKHGGGTDYSFTFQWAKEQGYEALMYVTDGYGGAPMIEPMPTLWLMDETDGSSRIPYVNDVLTFQDISWGQFVTI